MWHAITTAIDRFAMKSACRSVKPSPDGLDHAEEAFDLLQRPDFFAPEVPPARVTLSNKDAFQFDSPVKSGVPSNDIVPGRLVRAGEDWRTKPSVILLHGWNAELQYQFMLPFWSELLARRGMNALSFELPYHSSRRVGPIPNFLSGNLLHFLEATHQALADVRSLAHWLQENGSPGVSIWGTSLGAWLAGMALAHMPEFAAAALLTPVSRMDLALRDMPFEDFIRSRAAEFAANFSKLNLASHRPLCPRENVLLVAARHDVFAPDYTVNELEAAWQSEVWRHGHGHITILLSGRIMKKVAAWLAAATTRTAALP